MTKSAQIYTSLAEAERHNKAEEALSKARNTISLITGILSALSRPASTLVGGLLGKSKKSGIGSKLSDADIDKYNELKLKKQSERLSNSDFKLFKHLRSLIEGGH